MNRGGFHFLATVSALAISAGAVLTPGLLHADGDVVNGTWRTISENGEEKSEVEIYEEGGKVFGRIALLKQPLDTEGKPLKCGKCEGADKDRPLLGLVIIRNMVKTADGYADGTIIDPNNGKNYRCRMEVVDGGKKLKVRGYIGFSLLGRTQTWLRK
jgi:uncharacterized protein (DUF2147 family)